MHSIGNSKKFPSILPGALEEFYQGIEGVPRCNLRFYAFLVVSPTVVQESIKDYAPYFRGFDAVPTSKAALAYSKSVEGLQTGQVYSVLF